MLFNKKLYFNYIKNLENLNYLKFMIITIICIAIGILIAEIFTKDIVIGILLGSIIGLLLGYFNFNNNQIKIEELKMKLDIYNTIVKE